LDIICFSCRGGDNLFYKKEFFLSKENDNIMFRIPVREEYRDTKWRNPAGLIFFTLLFFFLGGLALQIYLVKIPKLLYSKGELFTGAGYTEIHAVLPVLKILAFILIVAAIISLLNIFRNVNKYFIFTVAAYVVVLILGTWIYPLILQKLVVEPNEIVKESTYISYNIEATQKAFGLDEVEEKQLRRRRHS